MDTIVGALCKTERGFRQVRRVAETDITGDKLLVLVLLCLLVLLLCVASREVF